MTAERSPVGPWLLTLALVVSAGAGLASGADPFAVVVPNAVAFAVLVKRGAIGPSIASGARVVVAALLALFAAWNLVLMDQVRRGALPADDTIDFVRVIENLAKGRS